VGRGDSVIYPTIFETYFTLLSLVWNCDGSVIKVNSAEIILNVLSIYAPRPVTENKRFHKNRITPNVVNTLPQLLITFQA